MSSPSYQALPSDDYDDERPTSRPGHVAEHIQLAQDPRFNPPTPPWWKRALLILFIISMFWLYFSMRASMQKGKPQVLHSHRYSKQHKYRPAASPIITEILKDGRTRIRGAVPTA
ncbi:hypothetical protein V8E53_008183 [Lactarius tabidus]